MGRGKMAAKRQVPMGKNSSEFVVGKQKLVDVWKIGRRVENNKATKKVSWCKTCAQKGAWQNGCLTHLGLPATIFAAGI